MMNCDVYADNDDEFIQIDDFYTYSAYKYWGLYGLSADKETSYTNTLNTISQSSSSGSFSFNGSFSGSFDATVELAISGLTTTDLDDVGDILSSRTFYYFGEGSETQPLIEMSISSGDNQGTEYIPRYGCTYNPSATGASATMTCTPNTYDGAFTMPDQDIKVTSIDVAMNSVTDYQLTLTLKNENTVRGSLSGTLGLTGSGQGNFTLNENGSSVTTSVNTNSLKYVLPVVKGNIDNTRTWAKGITINPNDNLVFISLVFGVNNTLYGLFNAVSDYNTSQNIPLDIVYKKYSLIRQGGALIEILEIHATEDRTFYIKFNNNGWLQYNGFIPLYVGFKSHIPDDLYRYVYGKDRLLEFLEHGNTQSQSAANGMNQVEQDFVGKTDELIDFEGDTFNSMDSAIDGVQLDNNIIAGSGFLNAANWVRVQFDNLISYSPLSNILVFSLSLGFALLIIGKVR